MAATNPIRVPLSPAGRWRAARLLAAALLPALACLPVQAGEAPAPPARAEAPPTLSFNVPAGQIEVKVQRGKDPNHVLPITRVPALKEGDTLLIKPVFAAPRPDLKWVLAYAPVPLSAFDKPEVKCLFISDRQAWTKFQPLPVSTGRRLILLFLPYDPGWNLGRDAVRTAAEKDMREHWGPFRDLAIQLASAQQTPTMVLAALNSLKSATRTQAVATANADRLRRAAQMLGLPDCPKTGNLNDWKSWATSASNLLKAGGGAKPGLLGSAVNMILPGAGTLYAGAVMAVGSLVQGLLGAKVAYEYVPAMALPTEGDDSEYALGLWIDRMPTMSKNSRTALLYSPVSESSGPGFAIEASQPLCVGLESGTVPVKPAVIQAAICYGGTDWTLDVVDGPQGLSATLDPAAGGFVIDAAAIRGAVGDQKMLQGVIKGKWGFDEVASKPFPFFLANHRNWSVDPADRARLVAGTPQVTFVARADGPARVKKTTSKGEGPNPCSAEVTQNGPAAATITVDLSKTAPGDTWVRIEQEGVDSPDAVKLQVYEPLPTVTGVEVHAGDRWARLSGDRLEQVKSVSIGGLPFGIPVMETDPPRLFVQRAEPVSDDWEGKPEPLQVNLKDGRVLQQPATVQVRPARPRLEVAQVTAPQIQGVPMSANGAFLVPPDAVPTVTLHAVFPTTFSPDAVLEMIPEQVPPPQQPAVQISTANGLDVSNETLKATFKVADVLKQRPSGRILMRVRDGRAGTGDWVPMLQVVTLPAIERVALTAPGKCRLYGTGLQYVVDLGNAEEGPFVAPDAASPANAPAAWRQYPLNVGSANVLYLRVQDCPVVLRVSPPKQEPQAWQIAGEDRMRLIRTDGVTVVLRAPDPRWVTRVWLEDQAKKPYPATTAAVEGGIRATFNLAGAAPGPACIMIEREGIEAPETVGGLVVYDLLPRFAPSELRAGEKQGVLTGERLGAIKELTLGGKALTPVRASEDQAQLTVQSADPFPIEWDGKALPVHAVLADGRAFDDTVRLTVRPGRPAVAVADIRTAEPMDFPFTLDRDKFISDKATVTLTLTPTMGYVFRNPSLQVRGVPPAGAGELAKVPCIVGPAAAVAGPFPVAGLWGQVEFRVVDGDAGQSDPVPLGRQVVRLPGLEKLVRSEAGTYTLFGTSLELITGVAVKAGDAPAALQEGVRPAGNRQMVPLPALVYAVAPDRKHVTLFLAVLDSKQPVEATIAYEEPAPPPAPAPAPAPPPPGAPAPGAAPGGAPAPAPGAPAGPAPAAAPAPGPAK